MAEFPHTSIAFKCTFCDGGRAPGQIGFNGVCSDSLIRQHITVEHQSGCISTQAPCFLYFSGALSRRELDAGGQPGQCTCWESQLMRSWRVPVGLVPYGARRGAPLPLNQIRENSLCLLTTRNPGCAERERYVFAVFIIDDPRQGCGQSTGYLSTKPGYKLKLSPEEAERIPFWRYYANQHRPEVPLWNSIQHRYLDHGRAAAILRDIAKAKAGTPDESLADRLYTYFCTANNISPAQIGDPDGALTRAAAATYTKPS